MIRLNLGAGDQPLEGWENLDGKNGDVLFPLARPDNSADEIRASHVLEHFGHHQVGAVLMDWVRVLKPGGLLNIAVPDFEWIARAYLDGHEFPVQGYLMGGQVDDLDYHKAAFDRDMLTEGMRKIGLVGIHDWVSEIKDCATLPVSLNLAGWKRPEKWPKVSAVMSVPRLGFMDNFFTTFSALGSLGFRLRKTTGAFWGQCLTRAMEQALAEDDPEYILTVDYDTVYTRADVEDMLAYAQATQADAVAPIQASRTKSTALFFMSDESGEARKNIPREEMNRPLLQVNTAHFGCTLLRASKLREMKKPWFWSTPDPEMGWDEGRVDDDIFFWHRWAEMGNRLWIAPRVVVGHCELMVNWPDENLQTIYQQVSEYHAKGKPKDVWR